MKKMLMKILLLFVMGRDNRTKWNLERPPSNVRKRSHNIVTHLPGVKGNGKNAKTVMQCWKAFFTDQIPTIVVENIECIFYH